MLPLSACVTDERKLGQARRLRCLFGGKLGGCVASLTPLALGSRQWALGSRQSTYDLHLHLYLHLCLYIHIYLCLYLHLHLHRYLYL